MGGRTSTSAVKLTTATARAHWNQGYLKPGANVMFAGTVGAASSLRAALRPDDRPGVVTAKTDFAVATAGPFTAHMLPPRPIPGKYTLSVSGKSGTTTLDPVKIAVTIPSPPEGVLDQAQVGTGPNGRGRSTRETTRRRSRAPTRSSGCGSGTSTRRAGRRSSSCGR